MWKKISLLSLLLVVALAKPQFSNYDYQGEDTFDAPTQEPGFLDKVTGFVSQGIKNVQNFFSGAVGGGPANQRQGSVDEPGKRPIVYFDVTADGEYLGRIHMELFSETTPKTAENFRQLVTGQNGYGYKNSKFHRVIPGFMLQGGDFTNGDGTGGYSIYGKSSFEDENFIVPHASKGMLSMANAGPDTNGSQFFITVEKTPWLDGKHTVFGRVADLDSFKVVQEIEKLGSSSGTTSKEIVIVESGQVQ